MRQGIRAIVMVACGAAVAGGGAGDAFQDTAVIQGTMTCEGVRDCAGALVYVENVPGRTFSPSGRALMDQVRLTFVPYVLPVLVGTEVDFPNSDEVRHNVYSSSLAKRFNLGTYRPGVTKRIVFDRPGVVELLCSVHAEMSAYVVVLGTPYVAHVTPEDGAYSLTGVPAGTYSVCGWRPGFKAQCRPVTVRVGQPVQVGFDLRR